MKESPSDPEIDHGKSHVNSLSEHKMENEYEARSDEDKDERMVDQDTQNTSNVDGDTVNSEWSNRDGEDMSEKTVPGVLWDVFRHQDIPKLIEFLRTHWKEFGESNSYANDFVSFFLKRILVISFSLSELILLAISCLLLIQHFRTQLTRPLYDETLFLDTHHKRKLKEEFGKNEEVIFLIILR